MNLLLRPPTWWSSAKPKSELQRPPVPVLSSLDVDDEELIPLLVAVAGRANWKVTFDA